ncbi:hypothetical protein ABTF55_22005, partial [Acinetobacter baumannii]
KCIIIIATINTYGCGNGYFIFIPCAEFDNFWEIEVEVYFFGCRGRYASIHNSLGMERAY